MLKTSTLPPNGMIILMSLPLKKKIIFHYYNLIMKVFESYISVASSIMLFKPIIYSYFVSVNIMFNYNSSNKQTQGI